MRDALAIEARLEKLERANLRLKAACGTVALVLVAVSTIAAALPEAERVGSLQDLQVQIAERLGVGTSVPETSLQVGSTFTAGSMPPPTSTKALWVAKSFSDDTSQPVGVVGGEQTSTLGGSVQAFEGFGVSNNASGTVTLNLGVLAHVQHLGAGALASGRALQSSAQINGAGDVDNLVGAFVGYDLLAGSSGDAANAIGLHVRAASDPGSGSVTNGYGVRIDSQVGTNTWGVYQSATSDSNYFAGSVGFGATVPSAPVDVDGGAGRGIIEVDGATGGCLKIRDTDDAGWTYCTVLNGTISCSITAC